MNHWLFLFRINQKRVAQAIARAESRTSGEIRVFVTHKKCPDALRAAREHFDRLGMAKTKQRNGVLIFISPRARTFAIIGDQGVHEKCGDAFWSAVSDAMSAEMKSGHLTDALVHAVERAGALLAEHFARLPGDQDELPDELATD
jgi:uncharacterized membrane protein